MENKINIVKNKHIRKVWFIAGIICTGLGIAGYILPVMPGTTFILLAAYCFTRSNKEWYDKLLNSKWFGQTIRDFQEKRGMSLKAKVTAISMILTSIGISLCFASNKYVMVFLLVCSIISISIILKQKTKK
jgi:uncharacterized membrane protein YbaN (DUF454 family)